LINVKVIFTVFFVVFIVTDAFSDELSISCSSSILGKVFERSREIKSTKQSIFHLLDDKKNKYYS